MRKTVPGPFVGLEGDLAAEERIVGPRPVFRWLAWIGVNFERTAPHALPFLVQGKQLRFRRRADEIAP